MRRRCLGRGGILRGNTRFIGVLALCAALGRAAYAQEADALLIPARITIGDRARLVVSVPGGASGQGPLILDVQERLPQSKDMLIHRIELETKGEAAQVIIDFSPFAVGMVALPPIVIGPHSLKNLRVRVDSVLHDASGILAPEAPPLAAPGTISMIFAGLIILILGVLGAMLGGRRAIPAIGSFRERRRQKNAYRSFRRLLDNLSGSLGGKEQLVSPGAFFDSLTRELRDFLSLRSGLDCHALTTEEFRNPLALPLEGDRREFVCRLLSRSDDVRFGRAPASTEELEEILGSLRAFLDGWPLKPRRTR